MNNNLQVLQMGDGGPAAYFTSSWTMRAATSWMLTFKGKPMCAPNDPSNPVIYDQFVRGFYDRLGTLLLYSREIWPASTINGKEVPATRWRHLSMSFHESDLKAGPELYGRMRQVLPRDLAATEKWLDCFYGSQQQFLLCEPPQSDHGKKFDVWHYRLLCDESWLPPRARAEVPDNEFSDAGWMTFNEAMAQRKMAAGRSGQEG